MIHEAGNCGNSNLHLDLATYIRQPMASPTALAYAIVVVNAVLLAAAVLQVIYGLQVKRRQARGTPSAPPRAILLLIIAAGCLIVSYIFDISATALLLVQHSTTPPPTGANLALVVVSLALSQGFAPALVFMSVFRFIEARLQQSVADSASPRSRKHKALQRQVEFALPLLLPLCVVIHLALFTKAVLETPVMRETFYRTLDASNYFHRASTAIQALLFVRVAYRALTVHLANVRTGERDPIIRVSILFTFVPTMFIRTLALLLFTPLASTYATASKPASSVGLVLAYCVIDGLTIITSIQCLFGAAMRPAAQWSPDSQVKTPGEREVEGEVPGDIVGKHKQHDSIALSPTTASFGEAGFQQLAD
jgi:hypothetical protein